MHGKRVLVTVAVLMLTLPYVANGAGKESRSYEQNLLQGILRMSPVIALSGGNLTSQCRSDMQEFIRDLNRLEYWAFQMYDSTGRPNSGFLSGNINAYGDFKQCLDVSHPRISGKYCLLGIDADLPPGTNYQGNMRDLVESAYSDRLFFGHDNNAPGGLSPASGKFSWGFCIPSSCTADDLKSTLEHILEPYNSPDTGLQIRVIAPESSCTAEKSKEFTLRSFIVMLLVGGFCSLPIFSTIYDQMHQSSAGVPIDIQSSSILMKMFLAFSLKRTVPLLLHYKKTSNDSDIACVHGIRVVFVVLLYITHKIFFSLFFPIQGKTNFVRTLMENEATMVFRAAINHINAFVIISGLLTAYIGLEQLRRGKTMNIPKLYFKRYIKFTPLFAMIVLVIRDIVPFVLRNPHNIHFLDQQIAKCQDVWKPLTYTGNIGHYDNLCYPISHQLYSDMQLYLISPFLVLFLWKFKSAGFKIVSLAAIGLCCYTGYIIYDRKLTTIMYHGMTYSVGAESMDKIYLHTLHRLGPYLMGVLIGYVLHATKGKQITLTKSQQMIGHALAIFGTYYAFFWLAKSALPTFKYDALEMAVYSTLQPIFWSAALGWLIFVCNTGHAVFLNWFFSLPPWVIFSKIAFGFYMVKGVLIILNLHMNTSPLSLTVTTAVDIGLLFAIVVLAAVASLIFSLPITLIEKYLAMKPKAESKSIDGHSSLDAFVNGISKKDELYETTKDR